MDTSVLIGAGALAAVFIAWAVGHFGTGKAAWGAVKAEAKTLETKAAGIGPELTTLEHEAAQAAADAAVKGIVWLTDKSTQLSAIAKAQSEMAAKDALLAHVKTQLPQ